MTAFSRIALTLIVTLFTATSWAKDEGEALARELCEGLLGHTLVSVPPEFKFDVSKALGARGFLGSFPEPTSDNRAIAASQGVIWWGHSMRVVKNEMAAAEHDRHFDGLSKVMYFLSDVDVSDLSDDTDKEVVQSRFVKVFETGRLVYFDMVDGRQTMREVPREVARRVIHPKKIEYFTKDDRGARFTQGGWVFPQMRGVLTYKNVFESGSGTIKDIVKDARGLERQGYQILFNHNPVEALEKSRDQMRIEKDEQGKLIVQLDNSRYGDSHEFEGALDNIKKGRAISVEVRDPKGKLVAGIFGERNGNIFHLDTVFYDYVDRETGESLTKEQLGAMQDVRKAKSLMQLAKIAALATVLRLHDHGINVSDVGMVSNFTAGIKGVYISGDEFAGFVNDLSSRPQVDVDLTTPFSFVSRR